jgi:hypothetical protein
LFKEKFGGARDNSLSQIGGANCHCAVPVCQAQGKPPNWPESSGRFPAARGENKGEFFDSSNLGSGKSFPKEKFQAIAATLKG